MLTLGRRFNTQTLTLSPASCLFSWKSKFPYQSILIVSEHIFTDVFLKLHYIPFYGDFYEYLTLFLIISPFDASSNEKSDTSRLVFNTMTDYVLKIRERSTARLFWSVAPLKLINGPFWFFLCKSILRLKRIWGLHYWWVWSGIPRYLNLC